MKVSNYDRVWWLGWFSQTMKASSIDYDQSILIANPICSFDLSKSDNNYPRKVHLLYTWIALFCLKYIILWFMFTVYI